MDDQLKPDPHVGTRAGILAAFMLPLFLSTVSLPVKIGGFAFWTLLIGSYRISWLRSDRFEQQYVIAFVPLKIYKWRLKRIEALGVDIEEPLGCLWVVLCWVWSRFVRSGFSIGFFPGFAGNYRIWLLTRSEKRVLAWQGSCQDTLNENVERFERATGLKSERTNFNR